MTLPSGALPWNGLCDPGIEIDGADVVCDLNKGVIAQIHKKSAGAETLNEHRILIFLPFSRVT